MNLSISCKFQCVGLQAEKHLHHSLLIGIDDEVIHSWVSGIQLDVVVLGLSALDQHHLLHTFLDVEFSNVLPELSCFYLSKV